MTGQIVQGVTCALSSLKWRELFCHHSLADTKCRGRGRKSKQHRIKPVPEHLGKSSVLTVKPRALTIGQSSPERIFKYPRKNVSPLQTNTNKLTTKYSGLRRSWTWRTGLQCQRKPIPSLLRGK